MFLPILLSLFFFVFIIFVPLITIYMWEHVVGVGEEGEKRKKEEKNRKYGTIRKK